MSWIRRARAAALARLRLRRRRGSRGAVAVEAAMITPLIFLLLFGIIEFGFVFKNYLAVVSSARSGVRIASAEPRNASYAQDAANAVIREGTALELNNIEQLWVYEANPSTGFPVGFSDFSGCSTCYKFTVSPGGAGWVATPSGSSSWPATSQNACTNDINHDYVGVYIQYDNPGITGLIFDSLTLSDHSVMSLEPLPLMTGCRP